jgi:PKD repeat protein
MKQLVCLGIVCLVGLVGANSVLAGYPSSDPMSCVDLNAQRYQDALGMTASSNPGFGMLDTPIGEVLWQYTISGGSDNSPKAIRSIPDINGDGIDDVLVASEDYYIRCLDGSTGEMIWAHEIYPGPVYLENGLEVIPDVDGDGYADVVAAATGGARLIQCISGLTGEEIWTHDTHEYGDGGWVYEVDCYADFNTDDINDVLAVTGDDSSGTGPTRVYCLNGENGLSLWECPLGGPGFAVMSIADCTGDGIADVLAGYSDDSESDGYAKAIDGVSGSILWSFPTPGSSVWALQQIDDVDGDGIPDVAIGDFLGSGNIYGLSAASGEQLYHTAIGSIMVLQLERLADVNNDGHADLAPGHTGDSAMALDGMTGEILWTHPVADQCWHVADSTDVSGDGVDDLQVGTLYNDNYVYVLNGATGDDLFSTEYGEAIDALASIHDVDGDRSMEMVAGGRYGLVTCFAGGPNAMVAGITPEFSADVREGDAPLLVHFTDESVTYNTTITSWAWDFNGDGTIDSTVQDPSWTYESPGVFSVSLTVSDGIRSETETKPGYITVHEPPPMLVFGDVRGGFARVSVEVRNLGPDTLAVTWNLSMSGGLVLKRAFNGSVDLAGNGSEVLVASPVLGFGRAEVGITARTPGRPAVTKEFSVFVLGILILVR